MNTSMKKTQLGLLISNILGSFFLSFAPANAIILVEPIVTTPNENFPNGEEIGTYLKPITDILLRNAPDAGNQQNLLNSTGYTINKLSLLLLPQVDSLDEDVAWGDVNGDGIIGLSNIFNNIKVTPDFLFQGFPFPQLELTSGTIENGKGFTLQFITSPDLTPVDSKEYGPLVTGFFYDGSQPVPEPSNILGFTFATIIGIWLRKSKLARR